MSKSKNNLIKKLEDKTANVAVLGLGYVGLPFAAVFAEAARGHGLVG